MLSSICMSVCVFQSEKGSSWIEAELAKPGKATVKEQTKAWKLSKMNVLAEEKRTAEYRVQTLAVNWYSPKVSAELNRKLTALVKSQTSGWSKKSHESSGGNYGMKLTASSGSIISMIIDYSEWADSASLTDYHMKSLTFSVEDGKLKPLSLSRFINWGKEKEFWSLVSRRYSAETGTSEPVNVQKALHLVWHLVPTGVKWNIDLTDGRGRFETYVTTWNDLRAFLR